jgi:hypothetical protein
MGERGKERGCLEVRVAVAKRCEALVSKPDLSLYLAGMPAGRASNTLE